MDWMEQNIDAYRIVSEVLGDLRVVIREVLERVYGDEWYRKGLPEEVFEHLVAAKEREKSIDWYEGQYQQIMDYATFPDLILILEKNEDRFPDFVNLAPNRALLQARFLELDVMRAKLGRARPISETELSFLGTFHLRFRKAAEKARAAAAGEEIGPPASATKNAAEEKPHAASEPPPAAAEPENATEEKPQAASEPPPAATEPENAAEEQPQAVSEPPLSAAEPEEPGPPRRPVQTAAGSQNHSNEDQTPSDATAEDDIQSVEIPVEGHDPGESEPEEDGIKGGQADAGDETEPAPENGDDAATAVGPKKRLSDALDNNDHQTVLRELYREVTAIAEGVWSSDVTPAPFVWDRVTASDWYEANFSRLGLHSLSVFYEITSKVDKKLKAGEDRKELHEYLKETNFAKTLLSLRDMFEENGI